MYQFPAFPSSLSVLWPWLLSHKLRKPQGPAGLCPSSVLSIPFLHLVQRKWTPRTSAEPSRTSWARCCQGGVLPGVRVSRPVLSVFTHFIIEEIMSISEYWMTKLKPPFSWRFCQTMALHAGVHLFRLPAKQSFYLKIKWQQQRQNPHWGVAHWWPFQRTSAPFPELTWCLIMSCKSSSREQMPSSGLQRHKACMWYANTHIGKCSHSQNKIAKL